MLNSKVLRLKSLITSLAGMHHHRQSRFCDEASSAPVCYFTGHDRMLGRTHFGRTEIGSWIKSHFRGRDTVPSGGVNLFAGFTGISSVQGISKLRGCDMRVRTRTFLPFSPPVMFTHLRVLSLLIP